MSNVRQIHEQVKLPMSVALEVVLQGIRIRLGRSIVTILGVALGIAFLMSILTTELVKRGVADEARTRTELQRMISFLAADTGPLDGRTIGIIQAGPVDPIELRFVQRIYEQNAKINWVVTNGSSAAPTYAAATPLASIGTEASAVVVLGAGRPEVDYPAVLSSARQKVVAFTHKNAVLGGATDQTATIAISGNPTGGSFTINQDGVASASLSPNASAPAVLAALEAIPGIGPGNVSVSGPAGGPWLVQFKGELGQQDLHTELPTVTGAFAGGVNPAVTIVSTAAGSAGVGPPGVTVVGLNREPKKAEKRKLELDAKRENYRSLWIIVVSLIVTVIGISNSMLMSVTERFREIGTMKCLGALSSFIRRLFLIESTLIGTMGALIGVAFGILFPMGISGSSYGMGMVLSSMAWSTLGLYAAFSLVVGVVLSMVAAVYPARFASRMVPAAALRSNI